MFVISDTRERLPGEIIPVKAELSGALYNYEKKYGAANSIDLDLVTRSHTKPGSDSSTPWLKVTLDQVYCVDQVVWYSKEGDPIRTWTCSQTDCSACKGSTCSRFSLTVSSERAEPDDLPLVSDCKNGDMVKLERTDHDKGFGVCEISVTGKQG